MSLVIEVIEANAEPSHNVKAIVKGCETKTKQSQLQKKAQRAEKLHYHH